jgi:hypothetical protein
VYLSQPPISLKRQHRLPRQPLISASSTLR